MMSSDKRNDLPSGQGGEEVQDNANPTQQDLISWLQHPEFQALFLKALSDMNDPLLKEIVEVYNHSQNRLLTDDQTLSDTSIVSSSSRVGTLEISRDQLKNFLKTEEAQKIYRNLLEKAPELNRSIFQAVERQRLQDALVQNQQDAILDAPSSVQAELSIDEVTSPANIQADALEQQQPAQLESNNTDGVVGSLANDTSNIQADASEQQPAQSEAQDQTAAKPQKSSATLLCSKSIVTRLKETFKDKYSDMEFNIEKGTVGFKNTQQLGDTVEHIAKMVKDAGHKQLEMTVDIHDPNKIDEYAKTVFASAAKEGFKPNEVSLVMNGKKIDPNKYPEFNKWNTAAVASMAPVGKISSSSLNPSNAATVEPPVNPTVNPKP